MAATDTPSEADLASAFRVSPEFGVEYLDSEFRELLLRYIKRVTKGFVDFDAILDIYQETLIDVHDRASQPGFVPDHPLRLVRHIARLRSIDHRRRCGHRPNTNEDAILGTVAADLRGSDIGLQWRLHMSSAERNEFWRILPEIIATLPPRQRLVAECFVNHYEEFRERDTARPLADAVSAVTGQPESVAAVMSAWRFARERIAEELRLRGYTFINLE